MRIFILLLVGLASALQSLKAHVVEQIYADYTTTDGKFQLTIRFDAGQALPELRGNEESLQPRFEWLTSRTEAELARIKNESDKYLHEYLQFTWINAGNAEEKHVGFECIFPAWETTPPKFEERFSDTGYAYFDVICRGEIPEAAGSLLLAIPDGNHPDLAIGFPDENIITIYPDNQTVLIEKDETMEEIRTPDKADSFFNFLIYGYHHVVPEGWDHVLFILALVCLTFSWKPLLTQSLVFTVGHTITLGLAVSNTIPPLSEDTKVMVEIFIAATIAYVAIENLLAKKVRPHRLVMIFLFGLIHGLGFASVLGDKIRAAGNITLPLTAANLGVELGQVTVIGITLIALYWAREKPYFHHILRGISAVIAVTGCYWIIDRLPF